jgi:histidinol-phosphate aminotransferase
MMKNTFSPSALLRPEVAGMEEYTPILPFEVLSKRLGLPTEKIVKLDANENPYGPLPVVAEALAEYPFYHIYPDPEHNELRAALSAFTRVPAANILPSHGADELLDYLCRLFLRPGDAILTCPPTFGMYSFDAGLAGGQVIEVWRKPDYGVDVAEIWQRFEEIGRLGESSRQSLNLSISQSPFQSLEDKRAQIKLLFLTSPNNPSGNWLPDAELRRLLELPALVVLDEAYVEFAEHPSRVAWVLEHDNLVVLRTFSKAAGIAGLRLGYGIFPDWLMAQLWKFKQPYNVNVAATVAGLASLRHINEIYAVVQKIKTERKRLYAALQQIPFLHPHPSQANFVLCDVRGRNARALKQALEQHGVLVRYYNKPGLENCIRISVGRPEQTDRLLEVLHTVNDGQ